jgi:hypothetical protein
MQIGLSFGGLVESNRDLIDVHVLGVVGDSINGILDLVLNLVKYGLGLELHLDDFLHDGRHALPSSEPPVAELLERDLSVSVGVNVLHGFVKTSLVTLARLVQSVSELPDVDLSTAVSIDLLEDVLKVVVHRGEDAFELSNLGSGLASTTHLSLHGAVMVLVIESL